MRTHAFRMLANRCGAAFAIPLGAALLIHSNSTSAHPSNGIVVDSTGAVIFADERRNIVFRVDTNGHLSRWVARKHAHELFLDSDGHLYGEHLEYVPPTSAWRSSIWRRDASGRITDVFGPAAGFAPGLLMDREGNRYQSNGNESPNGPTSILTRRSPRGRVTTLAGGPRGLRDGRGAEAQLGAVGPMAWGPDGAIYFVEEDAVRRVTLDGAVTTLARGFRGAKDPELPAQRLWGLTVDGAGAVLVADYGNRRVIKVSVAGGPASTVLQAEKPWSPTGVAAHGDTLFVLEHGFTPPSTHLGPRVRKLEANGTASVLVSVGDTP